MEYLISVVVLGVIALILMACAGAPFAYTLVPAEEREAAGLAWKQEDEQ